MLEKSYWLFIVKKYHFVFGYFTGNVIARETYIYIYIIRKRVSRKNRKTKLLGSHIAVFAIIS